MSDLINRQDAIDLVEHRMKHNPMKSVQFIQGLQDGYLRVISDLNRLPSADVVEVVRCRDCTWWKSIFSWNGKEHKVCVRESYEPQRDSNDYCSYAERREDER